MGLLIITIGIIQSRGLHDSLWHFILDQESGIAHTQANLLSTLPILMIFAIFLVLYLHINASSNNKIEHFLAFNFFTPCHFHVDCKIALVPVHHYTANWPWYLKSKVSELSYHWKVYCKCNSGIFTCRKISRFSCRGIVLLRNPWPHEFAKCSNTQYANPSVLNALYTCFFMMLHVLM